jgi:hypothetical protein
MLHYHFLPPQSSFSPPNTSFSNVLSVDALRPRSIRPPWKSKGLRVYVENFQGLLGQFRLGAVMRPNGTSDIATTNYGSLAGK